jgi:hypothetical protein
MFKPTSVYTSLLPFLAALVGCAGNGGTEAQSTESATTSMPAPTTQCSGDAASIRDNVFKTSCAGAGCHGSENPAAGLNLVDAMPDQLMGKSSALCSGWSLIVPGSPEKSFLYQKLVADKPACGDVMPLGSHLPAATSQCVADWIQSMAVGGSCETCGGSECVALASDPQHCGACNNACPTGVGCDNGACVCANGGQACGGVCVQTATDAKNCGKCGNACSAGSTCENGQCTCPAGLAACSGACVDFQSDALSCGACGKACAAKEVCLKGQCSAGCGTLTQCGSSCVDTQTSPLNCGGCDRPCAAGLACNAGKCSCSNGGQLCGSSCVDTKTDTKNCGGCGMACGAGEACVAGACQCAASGAVSFKSDVAPILQGACTSAGCHAGMKPKENLSLESTKSYGELVNVATSQCAGARKLVVPGSPSSSYLLQKLLNVDICTGTQMPKAGQTLPQKQIDLISGWICSGAPNN